MPSSRLAAVVVALTCVASAAPASERTLTIEQALALARERAPALMSARARLDEADGRVRDASVLFRHHPEIEAEAGTRTTPGEDDTTDLRFGLTHTFGIGGGRGSRIAAAKADRTRTAADADLARVDVLREAAGAFHRAVYAGERVRSATEAESLVVDLLRIAERRYQTGDIARLDVNVARISRSRARAEVQGAATLQVNALGDLRRVLGLGADEEITVIGEAGTTGDASLDDLLTRAAGRPDLRALAAEIERADAEERLGGSMRWPDVTLGVGWEREESSEIPFGHVGLSLPIFDHGQGMRDESRARSRRLRGEYDALQRAVAVDVQSAYAIHRDALAAARELEENALPLLDENEGLARRGYESGELRLSEVLLLRQQVIETRQEYLSRALEAAVAWVELQASAGVLQ